MDELITPPTTCPDCRGKLVVYRTTRPLPEYVFRYRQCACGLRIVSEERDTTKLVGNPRIIRKPVR